MITPIILSGGSGTRLWPFSREKQPKQFLKIFDDLTLLQLTIKRLDSLNKSDSIIVSGRDFKDILSKQIYDIGEKAQIILEPEGKNTAPAIALAANLVKHEKNHLLLVLSADHMIKDEIKFIDAITKAIPIAQKGKLVTFGIVPDSPFTGYGYIKKGSKIEESDAFLIDEFKEKPSKKLAKSYLAEGNYLWNSGIFLFDLETFYSEMQIYEPDIIQVCEDAINKNKINSNFIKVDSAIFKKCPNKSIDYALMENTSKGVVMPVDCGWSDIGTWDMIWEMESKDHHGNVFVNDIVTENTKNCLIRSEDKLIATSGLRDIIIIDTKDALLVASRDDPGSFKKMISKLKLQKREEIICHSESEDGLTIKFKLDFD